MIEALELGDQALGETLGAMEIGGRIYSRPWVDYSRSPNDLPGDSGIEITDLALATARRLARLIREG